MERQHGSVYRRIILFEIYQFINSGKLCCRMEGNISINIAYLGHLCDLYFSFFLFFPTYIFYIFYIFMIKCVTFFSWDLLKKYNKRKGYYDKSVKGEYDILYENNVIRII